MPESASLPPSAATTGNWGHRAAIVALGLLLLLAGVYDELAFAVLDRGWLALLSALHLAGPAAALQAGIHQQVTHRALLPGLSYAALYVGSCLLLLRLLLPRLAAWRLALRLYGGVGLAYLLLLLVGKVGGDLSWAYRLSRHLLDFLVSPLPVLALVVLLRGSRPAGAPAGEQPL